MDRMLDRKLAPAVRKLYAAESRALRRALVEALSTQLQLPVGPRHVQAVERALARRLPALGRRLGAQLAEQTRETQAEAIRSLASFMGVLKPGGTVLDDHRISESVIRRDKADLTVQRRTNGKILAYDVAVQARKALHTRAPDMKVKDLINHIHSTFDDQLWRVERTMRTETSRTFNTTQDAAFVQLMDEFPGIYRRWTELVNDITGAPLDNRVGKDSLVLHGQLAKPGHLFFMPPAQAPKGMAGRAWEAPPNRPNDRAVLTPWFEGSGVPGWLWTGSTRISLE